MHDDERMDRLLMRALSGEAPRLSPGFDAAVMRRAGPRRLSGAGRVIVATYILIAAAATAWLARDLPAGLTAVGCVAGLVTVLGASAYVHRLARPL